MAAFVTATSQRTKVDSKNFVADHPIPLWHRSLSQCPSVPAVANVPLRSSPLCSSHASPDGAQLSADAHAAPFLLSCSPGRTGKDRLTFTDSSAVLWMWQVHPREWCILSQPCASPVPKEQPNDQGWGCSRRAPTALLLTRQMGWALPCPALAPQEAVSAPGSQHSLCPSASPKQTTIGSHCQLPCSVTANSSSFLFLLSYLLYIYTISFWGFFIPLTYHYSLFSSVPLKEHINTPAYSVSCPCHQTNI